MDVLKQIKQLGQFIQFTRYNFRIVFANKFGYFLFSSLVFFLIVTGIVLYNDASIEEHNMYYLLIFPAILLIFYPTVFGIQNDKDSRMLETLFGIPNYRYKIYLIRLLMILVMVFGIIYAFGWLTELLIIRISILRMTYELMYPILFLGSLGFLLSTLTKSGNAAAVIMIIIGIIFWILAESLEESKWNIFLNPLKSPESVSQAVWINIVFLNRVYLIIGSIISVLWGLTNLQKREKLVK